MIIKCEQCQTKFRLDDAKLTDKGVKVRCAKCKHVFKVYKEQPGTELPADELPIPKPESAAMLEESARFTPGSETKTEVPAAPFMTDSYDGGGDSTVLMGANPFSFGDVSGQAAAPDAQEKELPPPQAAPEAEPAPEFSFADDSAAESADSTIMMDTSPFGTPPAPDKTAPVSGDEVQVSSSEVDFASFDFSGGETDADQTVIAAPPSSDFADETMIQAPAASAVPAKSTETQGLDFSDDDMFGTVVPPAPVESSEKISFDFGDNSFADSMELGGADSGQKKSTLSLEAGSAEPFSLGEIDFGDELTSVAVQQVNPDELKPSQEILFAPLAEAQETQHPSASDEELKKAFLADAGQTPQEELPPLPIASRRKQSPLFTGLIAAGVLLFVSVLGYFGFTSLSSDKGKAVQEAGKITVRGVKAAFIQNSETGPLLLITGEAVNEYPKPRAALQVKGMVYDAKGQVVADKTAYAGNPLTEAQLQSMQLDKIEAAMANQFGDSLANLEVAPGKGVPFAIVIVKPPKEAKDFGVEPAGSTVATGKQP